MKEWNKPELLSLGVENTFEAEEIKNDHNATNHYCHKGGVITSCQKDQSNHSNGGNKLHTWSGNDCDIHTVGGNSACCCYTGPGQS